MSGDLAGPEWSAHRQGGEIANQVAAACARQMQPQAHNRSRALPKGSEGFCIAGLVLAFASWQHRESIVNVTMPLRFHLEQEVDNFAAWSA
jgi:hypothetical protein